MTTALLVVLVLAVLYLVLRVHMLQNAVLHLSRIVNKPRRRLRAIQKEIKELEDELETLHDLGRHGAATREDFEEADLIREKLDRRLRALAGQREARPVVQPKNEERGRETG
jgi:protein-arginine kinase activator protein McsA